MPDRLPSWRDIANLLAVELEPRAGCAEPDHTPGVTEGCSDCESDWALGIWRQKRYGQTEASRHA